MAIYAETIKVQMLILKIIVQDIDDCLELDNLCASVNMQMYATI